MFVCERVGSDVLSLQVPHPTPRSLVLFGRIAENPAGRCVVVGIYLPTIAERYDHHATVVHRPSSSLEMMLLITNERLPKCM